MAKRLSLLIFAVMVLVAACTTQTQTAPPTEQILVPPLEPTAAPTNAETGAPAETPVPEETASSGTLTVTIKEYPVAPGSHPHDVAPAPDGTVWYTAQHTGHLGRLDPATGEYHLVALGPGSSPHGVIIGPDGHAWVTDSGQNAIVRVDAQTEEVTVYPLPSSHPGVNLNTGVFDPSGIHWFTGQGGVYGRLDPAIGVVQVFDAPRGRGPYGITATPSGEVFYASLAGSHIAQINPDDFFATPIDPPTPGQGARRVWTDSTGRIWVSEYNAGQVGVYNPADGSWKEWHLPAVNAAAYAVYVDDQDKVWLSDFGSNSLVRFDPVTEQFDSFTLPSPGASVRQILGRPGEIWGAESGVDKLVVLLLGS